MKKKILLPDEENARLTVERFQEINGRLSAEKERILRVISSHSRFLGNSIIRNPRALNVLTNEKALGRKKTISSHRAPLASIVRNSKDSERFSERLKGYKYTELSRIIYREVLGLCTFRQTMEEISDLASSVVRAVLDFYRSRIEDGDQFEFVVLGMGKLGGRLLNLSSDIDLVYLYKSEELRRTDIHAFLVSYQNDKLRHPRRFSLQSRSGSAPWGRNESRRGVD